MSLGYDQIQIYPFELVELEQLTLTKNQRAYPALFYRNHPRGYAGQLCGNDGKEHCHPGEPAE